MTITPEQAIIAGAASFCVLIVLAVILIVRHDRKRIRIDPMMAVHGDYPGFSREQLARFQSAVHGDNRHKTGGVL